MKAFLLGCLLILSMTCLGQVTITGNTKVQPGAQETYYASFTNWDWQLSSVAWSVSGGTIVSSDSLSCTVKWSNTSGSGWVAVMENWFSQTNSLTVFIGDPVPSIYPVGQTFSYGTAPATINILFNYPPSGNVSYQWQEWNLVSASWSDLGQSSAAFSPPVLTQSKKFRCLVTVNGLVYQNLEAQVVIPALSPGSLSSATASPAYNSTVTGITAYPATGGLCAASAYTYVWEQSVENGPWTQIGTGSSSPAIPAIVGSTRIRRSVQCGSELLYSNTLTFEPAYTAIDFENRNYVREITVAKKGIRSWQEADQLPVGDKFQTTTYADGLGRSIQTVDKGVSSTTGNPGNDLVKHVEYDAAGRALKDFLPFASATSPGKFKTAAGTEQPAAIQNLYGEPLGAPTFALSETDNSPLNRVVKITPPGQGWVNAGVSTNIDFNKAEDEVQIWSLDDATDALLSSSTGVYGEGKLLKTTTTQNGKNVITYTDLDGKLILKKVQEAGVPQDNYQGWICTYNVYDDFGRLRYQLQPEAVNYLLAHNWTFDTDGKVLSGLCFQYRYDARGRNTWKKAPGAEALQMIYDERDRLVFTQDGNQRAKTTKEWTATLYDELDRPVLTALYHTGKSAETLQIDVDNAISSTIVLNNTGGVDNDLVVKNRDLSISKYTARNSIEFIPEFQSGTNDEFTAEIDPNATAGGTTELIVYQNPISNTDLNNASVCTILKYQFYDNYSFDGVKAFDPNIDNTTAYSTSDPNVQSIVTTQRTIGLATGSKVRVLGTDQFLTSTSYFDERGVLVQTLDDNLKSGQDVLTVQYHFDGRVMSTHSKHTTTGTGYTNFSVLTKNEYDLLGRMVRIRKNINHAAGFKTIVFYEYDELGRLKTKNLDPDYTGIPGKTGLESLAYSYNIQGNITGVNKDYALKTSGKYNKWGNFFGFYLGYEKTEGLFASANLGGQVTGQVWNTQGDDQQRKFDYSYDDAGRLTKAEFKERKTPNDVWSNQKLDFSVLGTGNQDRIKYDLNGNLLSMIHKGFALSSSTPMDVDKLDYSYFDLSNQLRKVTDVSATVGQNNGKAGDFKDGSNGTYNDYVYDQNGNLIVDYNKEAYTVQASTVDQSTPSPAGAAPAIKYNFLDKPEEITIVGKGTIRFVYDADGNKLQKLFTPQGSATPVVTTYIGGYVYKDNELQYIGFEEGRIRVMQEVAQNNGYDFVNIGGNLDLPNGRKGVFDYYLRDYQQNVRMILTEETHIGSNQATMEIARAASEESLFGQTGSGNEVAATRFPVSSIPGGWNNATIGNSVSRLSNLTKKNGPNAFLKVMAGDELTASSLFYFKPGMTSGTGSGSVLNDVLNSLVGAITGSTVVQATAEEGTTVKTTLNGTDPFKSLASPNSTEAGSTLPKAYLTVMFFDERLQFVSEGSTFLRVNAVDNGVNPLVLQNIQAPKNGYVYAYLSNESDEPVYFDNFKVTLNRGRIIEENHYYAYGLKIAAISSRKLRDDLEGKLDNQHLYNGKEIIEDADLGWYDYGFRSYDPQIGRFPQLDPLTFAYPYYTPYQYAGCEPITNVDVDGLEPVGTVHEVVIVSTTVPRAIANTAAQGGSLLTQIAPMTIIPVFFNQYVNGQGKSFLDRAGAGTAPSSQHIMGEDWQYNGRVMSVENVPNEDEGFFYSESKRTFSQNLWHNLHGDYPFTYSLINSPWVGLKTMLSGVLSYNKKDVLNLNGEPTTRDERYMGGVNALAIPIIAAVGAEMKAVNEGSALLDASNAAYKAADDAGSIFIKNKHLNMGSGNFAKFATTDVGTAQRWVQQALRSSNAMFLPNSQIPNTFQVVSDLGTQIGTKGQSSIRAIVGFDGRVINAFPVR